MTDVGLKPRPIKKIAIIGGGLMGSGIATAFISSNIQVVLKEINSELVQRATKVIEGTSNWEKKVPSIFIFLYLKKLISIT